MSYKSDNNYIHVYKFLQPKYQNEINKAKSNVSSTQQTNGGN